MDSFVLTPVVESASELLDRGSVAGEELEAGFVCEASEEVFRLSVVGGRCDDFSGFVESVGLPSEASFDEPVQDSGAFVLEFVIEVGVLDWCTSECRVPGDDSDAGPDAPVAALDLGQVVRLQPQGVGGVEFPGVFVEAPAVDSVVAGEVLDLGFVQVFSAIGFYGDGEAFAEEGDSFGVVSAAAVSVLDDEGFVWCDEVVAEDVHDASDEGAFSVAAVSVVDDEAVVLLAADECGSGEGLDVSARVVIGEPFRHAPVPRWTLGVGVVFGAGLHVHEVGRVAGVVASAVEVDDSVAYSEEPGFGVEVVVVEGDAVDASSKLDHRLDGGLGC